MKRTESISQTKWISALVKEHTELAMLGVWDGRGLTAYFEQCRFQNTFRGITTIFTRDVGYHSSGWWKNPDYERCYHLSISFFDPATIAPMPQDKALANRLVKAFYTRYAKWVWCEPPYSESGKRQDVWHYRLFCDAGWQPIRPRGEVYSKELTEAGWHSFSDVQDAIETSGTNPNVRIDS